MALPGAGALNKRVTFQRERQTADGAGGYSLAWQDYLTVWARYTPERGREVIQADRLASTAMALLVVRSSTDTRQLTAADRVLVDKVPHQIRAIANPDQQNRFLEMVLEQGVAT